MTVHTLANIHVCILPKDAMVVTKFPSGTLACNMAVGSNLAPAIKIQIANRKKGLLLNLHLCIPIPIFDVWFGTIWLWAITNHPENGQVNIPAKASLVVSLGVIYRVLIHSHTLNKNANL